MKHPGILESLKNLERSEKTGIHFAGETGALRPVTYSRLIQESRRVANGLLRRGVKSGDPVILVATEPESALVVILGCMMLGCPPAPIYPPQNLAAVPAFLKYVQHVADRSRATFLVADEAPYRILGGAIKQAQSLRGMEKTGKLLGENDGGFAFTGEIQNPVAFLQFTSGSTSTPKGVLVMHDGLTANLQMIRESCHMNETSAVVTWLPVYHDMGLIGTVLNAITLPCNLVVIPPLLFLKKPRLWLELITRFHGTHTAAPNFAYGLCTRRVEHLGGLDLSSMTTFICGAEPVLARTMNAFVQYFEKAGLSAGAMVPAYGLAEATLAVTFNPHGRGLISERVDMETLSVEGAALATDDAEKHRMEISSCGIPLAGLQVRIASESGAALAERMVGEIQVKGPSVSPGYIGDEQATHESRTADGWMRTGDLGYMTGGELYPCGRIKEVIIIRGKKYHAHDLESLASEVHGVRTGNVVAFATQKEGGESLVIVTETRHPEKHKDLAKRIRSHVAQSIGIAPDDVLVVPPGTLPKTSSGKLKRLQTRSLYERNALLEKPSTISALGTILKSRLLGK